MDFNLCLGMAAQYLASLALYADSQLDKTMCSWIVEPRRGLISEGSVISQTFPDAVSSP